ncbi:MAG TPA: hypothetical protein VHB74_14270 [Devosia sp.]|jgi:hypothetical protein|nr:hypothetical protein [Devosia sp.]
MARSEENTADSPPHADPTGVNPGAEGPAQPRDAGRATPPEPADPHPSDEERRNAHNPSPGGERRIEGREGDLEADPRNPGSPA